MVRPVGRGFLVRLSIFASCLAIALAFAVPGTAHASELATAGAWTSWGSWSGWQDGAVSASDSRQVETRQVVGSYTMVTYCCGNSSGARCWLAYPQSGFTLRLAYPARDWSVETFNSARRYPQGSYFTYADNVNGWISGPGTAYVIDWLPLFVQSINYKTQYRYRDRQWIDRPIANASVSEVGPYQYTGEAFEPDPVVTYDGRTLVGGTDYTISYEDNTDVGTGYVVLTGKGYYSGTKRVGFEIKEVPKPDVEEPVGNDNGEAEAMPGAVPSVPEAAVPSAQVPVQISRAAFAGIKARAYTGKAIKPNPSVTYLGRKLVKGVDYTLSYKNNKKVGKATVTVRGAGGFTGSKVLSFKIKLPKPKAKASVHAINLTNAAAGIDVSWSFGKKKAPLSQVGGYKIKISTSPKFAKRFTNTLIVKRKGSLSRHFNARKLLIGVGSHTMYYVRVGAYKKAGKTTYTTWSNRAACHT